MEEEILETKCPYKATVDGQEVCWLGENLSAPCPALTWANLHACAKQSENEMHAEEHYSPLAKALENVDWITIIYKRLAQRGLISKIEALKRMFKFPEE